MLTLCGFSASNYYNKVKLGLLEKDLPFEEELAWIGQTDLQASPLGKVPYLRTPAGGLCESSAMLEYVESLPSSIALLPPDPMAAAKVRELCIFLDLHLELTARALYPQAFFGATLKDSTIERTRKQLVRNVAAFAQLASWSSYIGGDQFSMADCCAIVHLPLISSASKLVLGQDVFAELPVRDYLARMAERPSVQRVNADRKSSTAAMLAKTS